MTSLLTICIRLATPTMKARKRTTMCLTKKWTRLTEKCTTNSTMKLNKRKKGILIPKNHKWCPLDSSRNTQDAIPIKISTGQNQPSTLSTWKSSSVKIHIPLATTTYKGHVVRKQINQNSTRSKRPELLDAHLQVDDMSPTEHMINIPGDEAMFCLLF